jgi:hypothetical protein
MNRTQLQSQSLVDLIKSNEDEASRLLGENARLKEEMHKILSEPPPPPSRLVDVLEGRSTRPTQPPVAPEQVLAMTPEKEVIYAALAIVRSWTRRHKKNWKSQETELMKAVSRLTWKP